MKAEHVNQADRILTFLSSLHPQFDLPAGVEIMNPYSDPESFSYAEKFYRKFYSDNLPRFFIFGINPGRYGGGITGIPFTDPVKLEKECHISNPYPKKPELSAEFIYTMIKACGGVENFYSRYFITALSPLGFTKDGRNLNYYDDRQLARSIEEFITSTINKQIREIKTYPVCFCLGEGENFRFFSRLNDRHHFFSQIIPLPHPRWVMQYRRRSLDHFISLYIEKLNSVI